MDGDVVLRVAFLVFLLAIPLGAILLQIYLSKKESRWPGLVLPLITLAISLMTVMSIATFLGVTTTSHLIDGERVIVEQTRTVGGWESVPGAIYVFLLMNIPTAIFLVIYKAARGKYNRRRKLEKMSVQDL